MSVFDKNKIPKDVYQAFATAKTHPQFIPFFKTIIDWVKAGQQEVNKDWRKEPNAEQLRILQGRAQILEAVVTAYDNAEAELMKAIEQQEQPAQAGPETGQKRW